MKTNKVNKILKEEICEYLESQNIKNKVIVRNCNGKYIQQVHNILIKGDIKINYDDDLLNYCAGVYYYINGKYNKAITYLSKINYGKYSTTILCFCYTYLCKYNMAETYYLEAISNGSKSAIIHLSIMYGREGKNDLVEKYLLLAIDKNISNGYIRLFKFYTRRKENDLIIKYSLEALSKNNKNIQNIGYKYLLQVCKTQTRVFILLESISSKNQFIKNKINLLIKNRYAIKCLNNKILFLSKKDQCPICLEENILVIPKECAHFYCKDCFIKIKKCSICDNK